MVIFVYGVKFAPNCAQVVIEAANGPATITFVSGSGEDAGVYVEGQRIAPGSDPLKNLTVDNVQVFDEPVDPARLS